ncbi:hypothetical protein ACHAWO_000307 [Cyclotella atomus]|uniref:Uncharacterized protein n=1 Tax=Cyclotella atomus TaxID=382360 RepID=A0ABD3P698_9STRA
MDLIHLINDLESSNHQNIIQAIVPFPALETEETPTQPTDSETGSSCCSSTRNTSSMDSSLSSAAASQEMSSSNDSKAHHQAATRRISYQDEIQSIDIESVSDPAVCIKRILDGLVAELKEKAATAVEKLDDTTEKLLSTFKSEETDKQDDLSSVTERQGCAKRRKSEDCDGANEKTNVSTDAKTTSSKQGEVSISKPHSTPSSTQKDSKQSQSPIQIIMIWMDTYQDMESIQLTCLQSLPSLLEHNTYRHHAQIDGLASVVFYNMAAFPKNFLLQLTAFHTLVVLLRPLGAMEGTLVKSSRSCGNGSAVFDKCGRGLESVDGGRMNIGQVHSNGSTKNKCRVDHRGKNNGDASNNSLLIWEENGVRVMLDTLRLYSHDRYLQAMGCWAMVNAALYPSLKKSLLKLGGVYVVTNAMMLHPNAEAVQFRGLFALINFVIPDGDEGKTPIHSHVYQIARLTILAMNNFQCNKSILNRGCLVLRNLSLTPAHATILARTPGCVDMLLRSRQICPRDALVQRSARTVMILIQRIAEKQLINNGVASINSCTAASTSYADRSAASAPSAPAKEESGGNEPTRRNSSY